jgi:hypothetical protein
MADLRSKFIEDYAGGLLNVSRQELASTGEVLSQDGFLSNATLFVEDGSGTKSGLLLGASLCEVVDPTTPQGAINVRYADRTYANVRDLKIFSTAIASAQAALSDATSSSITNLENAFELLEDAFDTLQNNFNTREAVVDTNLSRLGELDTLSARITEVSSTQQTLSNQISSIASDVDASIRSFKSVGRISKVSFRDLGAVENLLVDSVGSEDRTAGDYTITGLISSNGSGLAITANVDANGVVTITSITNGGSNFLVGDKVTIGDSQLGSGGADPVTLTVDSIVTSMTVDKLVPQVISLFNKMNEIIDAFA